MNKCYKDHFLTVKTLRTIDKKNCREVFLKEPHVTLQVGKISFEDKANLK